jgi:hypothetical protein
MEGYLEAILRKISARKKVILVFGEMQMKRLGYFQLIIKPNLKYKNKK